METDHECAYTYEVHNFMNNFVCWMQMQSGIYSRTHVRFLTHLRGEASLNRVPNTKKN